MKHLKCEAIQFGEVTSVTRYSNPGLTEMHYTGDEFVRTQYSQALPSDADIDFENIIENIDSNINIQNAQIEDIDKNWVIDNFL